MAISTPNLELGESIRSLLASVRRRIRVYIWIEALALAVIWIGLTFWFALALDYFPVLVWASEMPRAARAVLLAFMGAGLAWIIFKYLLRRVFTPIGDRSLAVLLERRFEAFHDSLVTSVELTRRGSDAQYNAQMLGYTHADADAIANQIRVGQVFNYRPLARKVALAGIMTASIIAFFAIDAAALDLAGRRLYLLTDTPWPRSAEIEVVGIEVQQAPAGEGQAATIQSLDFEKSHQIKVGRGANATLRVRAAASKRIPASCAIYYRTSDGDRGSAQMKKVGRVKDGHQYYSFDGKPFKGLLSDVQFDVMGHDHRVRDFQLLVVDSPALTRADVDCRFPDYMVNEALSQWLPRTETLTRSSQFPVGTQLVVRCQASKPLQRVTIYNPDTNQTSDLPVVGERFSLPAISLAANVTLELTLLDTDGVMSDRPQRLFIPAVRDEAPRVAARLNGISTLVTADVSIPVEGNVEDDYAVDRTWFELQINDRPTLRLPFTVPRDGTIDHQMDFRELRNQDSAWRISPTDKMSLVVASQDRYNLETAPQLGLGDRWDFVVVTPDELLASLEARELGLRKRFEQVIAELTATRDELLRVISTTPSSTTAADASAPDSEVPSEDGLSIPLRSLIAQRATQQSQKSSQEIEGIGASFADIRRELIHNRVDTEERKTRLQDHIVDPLATIVAIRFPEFDRQLERVEADPNDGAAGQLAVDTANELLLQLDAVLQRMLDLETYNELVDLVRALIEEQEALRSETKKQQAADLLK